MHKEQQSINTVIMQNGIFHQTKANLVANHLTEGPNDFVARGASERTLSMREVCMVAVARGGAEVSAKDMTHHMGLRLEEMQHQLLEGYSINIDGYIRASVQIKGVFSSPTKNYNPEKHELYFSFTQGKKMRQLRKTPMLRSMGVSEAEPYIVFVLDVPTGSKNDVITTNRNLKIVGSRLKIAGTEPEVGICCVDHANIRTAVPAHDIVTNNPKELIGVTPGLALREYHIEGVTQNIGDSNFLKLPRSHRLERVLIVT